MNVKWTKGLDKQQTIEMKTNFIESRLTRERLKKILEDELDGSIKEASSKEHFFMPAWSEYQASLLGEQRAYRKLINLIEE